MADAGKVAILPRGLWNADTVYEPLDLVYYDNNSFVALKESVGVTPVDGDTWMLVLSGISQDTINAIINGTQQVGDSAKLGGKDASEYALDTELANYLPLSGGTVSKGSLVPLAVNNTHKTSTSTYIGYQLRGAELGRIGFVGGAPYVNSMVDGASGTILYTGNKPSGTYMGNGDATERRIAVGGIGNDLKLWCAGIYNLTVGRNGAYGYALDSRTVVSLPAEELRFVDGVLIISTTSALANGNAYEYHWDLS